MFIYTVATVVFVDVFLLKSATSVCHWYYNVMSFSCKWRDFLRQAISGEEGANVQQHSKQSREWKKKLLKKKLQLGIEHDNYGTWEMFSAVSSFFCLLSMRYLTRQHNGWKSAKCWLFSVFTVIWIKTNKNNDMKTCCILRVMMMLTQVIGV